jgi:chromate transporter
MNMLLLVWEFLKTGVFAVGGGLATLPFLAEMARTYDWFTHDELTDMIAVSESLPGPLGVNMAVFSGFAALGPLGGVLAALALITPSLLIVTLVSKALQRYRENRIVGDVFVFLRPTSVGLIAGAVFPLITAAVMAGSRLNPAAAGVFAVMTAAVFIGERKKLHPLVFIAAGAVLGIIFGGFA